MKKEKEIFLKLAKISLLFFYNYSKKVLLQQVSTPTNVGVEGVKRLKESMMHDFVGNKRCWGTKKIFIHLSLWNLLQV